ncbi:MAG: hypothetical protein ACQEQD_08540 [Bacillota bacterium]
MPVITIQSLELTKKQKERIADDFIKILSEETKVPEDRIYLFFDGYELEDAAANRVLFSEMPPKKAVGKFNEKEE